MQLSQSTNSIKLSPTVMFKSGLYEIKHCVKIYHMAFFSHSMYCSMQDLNLFCVCVCVCVSGKEH